MHPANAEWVVDMPITTEVPFLDACDRLTLETWIRAPATRQRTVLRSRIVLLLGEGLSAREVARRLGVSRHTVDLWRSRFQAEGREALTRDRPGRGRRPSKVG
jgi:DNA-directed RNA polymerase specialized sigma24 family protein